ncbi:cytochrome c oxidase assembly protein [Xaviernesmea oryzae]|uniref:SURF1-like protein n=1 Tax=Xaviernesmea oryzae TaxID=464029 RepID=A0A1Q9ATX6_9HYPH|nr:SURF1 family protein [Xaviernesmea oryzae]OLP58799.1 cytochrome c oxidase assembly protein [Xaviernesmea oryzae]
MSWFGRGVGALLLLSLFVVLVGLGTWQVQRLAWKEKLIASIAERRTAPAQDLAGIEALADAQGDVDYRTVRVTGRFLNEHERHFFTTWEGQPGFAVYTPLELPDGRLIFVNRGFVPYERKAAETRAQGQPVGEITVSGLARARLDGKPSFILPDNDPAKNIYYWKDLEGMARDTGLAPERFVPFFIDADATANPGGLPVGGITLIDFPNNHLQYALTWYGLAAALLVVTSAFILRARKQGARGQD